MNDGVVPKAVEFEVSFARHAPSSHAPHLPIHNQAMTTGRREGDGLGGAPGAAAGFARKASEPGKF